MAPRRARSNGHDWATLLEPECTGYERILFRTTGRRALVRCDAAHDELIVDVLDLNPSQVNSIADELATLWPGFLAPAGVTLRIGDTTTWDHEAMALRSFSLRRGET
jgi:hypothetical protein